MSVEASKKQKKTISLGLFLLIISLEFETIGGSCLLVLEEGEKEGKEEEEDLEPDSMNLNLHHSFTSSS